MRFALVFARLLLSACPWIGEGPKAKSFLGVRYANAPMGAEQGMQTMLEFVI